MAVNACRKEPRCDLVGVNRLKLVSLDLSLQCVMWMEEVAKLFPWWRYCGPAVANFFIDGDLEPITGYHKQNQLMYFDRWCLNRVTEGNTKTQTEVDKWRIKKQHIKKKQIRKGNKPFESSYQTEGEDINPQYSNSEKREELGVFCNIHITFSAWHWGGKTGSTTIVFLYPHVRLRSECLWLLFPEGKIEILCGAPNLQ